MSQTARGSPVYELSGCVELVEMILDECTWSAVVVFSKINKVLRFIVFSYVNARIRHFILKFIPSADVQAFFDLLEATDSAVVGSLVRCIMSVDAFSMYSRVHPLQLNITVPHKPDVYMCDTTTGYRRWRRFLASCGYNDEYGGGEGIAPYHLSATSTSWSILRSVSVCTFIFAFVSFYTTVSCRTPFRTSIYPSSRARHPPLSPRSCSLATPPIFLPCPLAGCIASTRNFSLPKSILTRKTECLFSSALSTVSTTD